MLASYGEKNSNEAAAREGHGASALLAQLVQVHHNGVGTEAAVAILCNICILTKNQEAISAFAWGEPLLSLAYSHTYASHVLQKMVDALFVVITSVQLARAHKTGMSPEFPCGLSRYYSDCGSKKEIYFENVEKKGLDMVTKIDVIGLPYYSKKGNIYNFLTSFVPIVEVNHMIFLNSRLFIGIVFICLKTEVGAKRAWALDFVNDLAVEILHVDLFALFCARAIDDDIRPPAIVSAERNRPSEASHGFYLLRQEAFPKLLQAAVPEAIINSSQRLRGFARITKDIALDTPSAKIWSQSFLSYQHQHAGESVKLLTIKIKEFIVVCDQHKDMIWARLYDRSSGDVAEL